MNSKYWKVSLLSILLIPMACGDGSTSPSAADGASAETGDGAEIGDSASESADGSADGSSNGAGNSGDGDGNSGDGDGNSGDAGTLGDGDPGDGDPGDGDGDPGDGDGDSGDGDPGDGDPGDGDPGDSGDGDGDGEPNDATGDGDPGPFCGDGMLDMGEECDLGLDNSDTGWCKSDCTDQICGDGHIGPENETCDDGNGVDDDACSNACVSNVDAQCQEPYTVLDRADRNVGFNDGDGGIEWCDRSNSNKVDPQWQGLGWYRMMNPAGAQIPNEPPEYHACGTQAPGWMLEDHPALIDGVVGRTICFSWSLNSCLWAEQIQVVQCDGFYLYRLPNSTTCSLRYCATN